MVMASQIVSVLEQLYEDVAEPSVAKTVTRLRLGIARRSYFVHGFEHSPRMEEFLSDQVLRVIGCFIAGSPRADRTHGSFLLMDGRLEPNLSGLVNRHFHQYIDQCIDERLITPNCGTVSRLPIKSVLWLAYRGRTPSPAVWYPRSQTAIQGFPYLALCLQNEMERQFDEILPSPSRYLH